MTRNNAPGRYARWTAAAVLLLAVTPVLADLPGLPQAQAADAGADSRSGDAQKVVIVQTGPQRGSLFRQGAMAPLVASAEAGNGHHSPPVSFFSVQAPEPRKYKKNDVVTVVIREDSDSTTNGTGNSKKTQDFDLALEQFLQLVVAQSGLPYATTVNNPSNLPEIKFKYSNNTQADASKARTDSLSARISGTVVDVKPNGTMVIEAVKNITVDKEEQVFKLTGICRIEDIAVDNTILSTQLANLTLSKQTKGEVHDGTKRGWLNRLMDQFSPF